MDPVGLLRRNLQTTRWWSVDSSAPLFMRRSNTERNKSAKNIQKSVRNKVFFLFIISCDIFSAAILFKILCDIFSPSIKFDLLICVHRHALSFVHFLHHVLCLFVFLIALIWFPTALFQHFSKSGKQGWLTRWLLWSLTNPIWHSTLLCLHWSAITLLHFHLL